MRHVHGLKPRVSVLQLNSIWQNYMNPTARPTSFFVIGMLASMLCWILLEGNQVNFSLQAKLKWNMPAKHRVYCARMLYPWYSALNQHPGFNESCEFAEVQRVFSSHFVNLLYEYFMIDCKMFLDLSHSTHFNPILICSYLV